ncbi:CHASE2 domain-containing serine/threonine-protein kinase [Nostoc sphaeroides]|uniref:CHASE2 domain-containing serine/threonine-protein kinase n=1 Tax=Nostoc sphaeroides TaxID=446679 RepID=UPI002B3FFEF7|nr:CHASE2 domain-containing serine/threonine-protein kinase [Nostoc sphaeroides]
MRIGLDIFRDRPVNPGHNKLLERLQLSDIVTPICKHPDSKDSGTPPPNGIEPERVGFSDVPVDTDGTIRRNLLGIKSSKPCPTERSFSLLLALKYLEIGNIQEERTANGELKLRDVIFKPLQTHFGGYHHADTGGYQIMLNYRSGKEIAEKVTITDVLTGKVKPDLIKDRIVLIGSTSGSLKDFFNTPYSSGRLNNSGEMAGVEIHAQSISQILSVVLNKQPLFWALPEWGEVILIWGYALIGGLLVWRSQHPLWLGVGGVLVFAILFGSNFVIFSQAGWFPFVSPILGLVSTAGSVLAYTAYSSKQEQKEFAKLVQEQQELIAQLQSISRQSGMTLKQGTPASAIGEKILPDTLLNTRYKVIENLGSGGFSNTYLAVDTQRPGSPECVVKQLRPASIEAEYLDVLSRLFKTEAEILERLGKHEQIPQLMASFEENQQFYIVQQFIRGRELSQELLPGQRLVQTEVISLLKQVLEVLSFVHSYGVIHRDVKPSNLIRQESDGRIVLIDFGAVKQIQPQQQDELTIAIGTRGYAAPEQMAGIPRLNSDIYALGMIGIQALTGVEAKKFSRDPNTDGVTVEIPLNMPNISFRSWHELTDADNKLVAILDKMVCLDFYQRYQSAADVLMNLENI